MLESSNLLTEKITPDVLLFKENTSLPEGVVKDFFLNSTELGWGNSDEWIDLNIIKFKTGFYINVSVISLIGMMISWYFLRYFR